MDEIAPQGEKPLGPELPNYEDYRAVLKRAEGAEARAQDAEAKAKLDPMTGLLNQEAIKTATGDRVHLAEQGKARPAFFVFDVDKFKEEINDKYGHLAGDELLKEVAKMLKATLYRVDMELPDIAGRLGGDEFGILIDLTPTGGAEQAPWHVLEVIEKRITENIEELFKQEKFAHLKGRGVDISYGSSIWHNEMSAEQMIEEADSELYKVKRSKPGTRGVSTLHDEAAQDTA